jgi:hypothetical protein
MGLPLGHGWGDREDRRGIIEVSAIRAVCWFLAYTR